METSSSICPKVKMEVDEWVTNRYSYAGISSDHLPESEEHISVGEFVALRYQQPEGISSDPHHMVKDGGTLDCVPVSPKMPQFSVKSSWEIRAMFGAAIIVHSDCPWSSAMIMVPEKESTRWRVCVDYRWLNKVTSYDCCPIPQIDKMLDLVSGSTWFSF